MSAFVGWLGFCLFMVLYTVSLGGSLDQASYIGLYAVTFGIATLIVWALILLPLYSFVPTRSLLWHWWICTPCGLAAGTLMSCVGFLFDMRPLSPELFWEVAGFSFLTGGIIGGATCLFGSLTVPLFRRRDFLRVFARR